MSSPSPSPVPSDRTPGSSLTETSTGTGVGEPTAAEGRELSRVAGEAASAGGAHDLAASGASGAGGSSGESPVPPARARGRGNWRSLLLSTAAVGALLFVIFSIVPRPDSVTQPPVDVTPVARQLAEESHVTVWLPQLGEPGTPWKATSVRRGTSPTSFYAGYTRTDTDAVFVAVQQIPSSTPAAQADAWKAEALSNGREDGTSSVGGTTWTRFTTGGDPARRGLLGTRGDMTTVVSGLADYATLETVAGSLQPYRR